MQASPFPSSVHNLIQLMWPSGWLPPQPFDFNPNLTHLQNLDDELLNRFHKDAAHSATQRVRSRSAQSIVRRPWLCKCSSWPMRTAPIMALHQIIELRLLVTADQSTMQSQWIWICVPDTPEHGHSATETREKVQNRT